MDYIEDIRAGEHTMNKLCALFVYTVIAVSLVGCTKTTINPNFTSANPDLMRIGGESPDNGEPEMINMGSYCLRVVDKWKADGRTPDGQTIWSKDTFRKVTPCR
jgi:hypothetical protein